MNEVEELVGTARDLAEGVAAIASDLLEQGVDIARVHGRYVAPAVELLADVEALALQALGGEGSLAALTTAVEALADLYRRAGAELGRSGEL